MQRAEIAMVPTPASSARTSLDARVSSDELHALWRRYRAHGERVDRERLVLALSGLVRWIVVRTVREIPGRCDIDDFVSCGHEALIGALDRYAPERGASLEQYVTTRVRGALIDELRRQDWAPRSLRSMERRVRVAQDDFLGKRGRAPSSGELATVLGVSPGELRRHRDNLSTAVVVSLNAPIGAPGEPARERLDWIVSEDLTTDPEHAASLAEAKRPFRRAFASLTRREREVAVLLYVHGLTLGDVGRVLGISESRVCQLHAGLKRTLRKRLSSDEPLFADVA